MSWGGNHQWGGNSWGGNSRMSGWMSWSGTRGLELNGHWWVQHHRRRHRHGRWDYIPFLLPFADWWSHRIDGLMSWNICQLFVLIIDSSLPVSLAMRITGGCIIIAFHIFQDSCHSTALVQLWRLNSTVCWHLWLMASGNLNCQRECWRLRINTGRNVDL